MNKEEIEHIEGIKKILNFTTNNKEIGLQMNGEVCHLLLKYIKELEQKESILDKVTDKLKEDKEFLEFCRDRDMNSGYGEDEEDRAVRVYIESMLSILEGEKK